MMDISPEFLLTSLIVVLIPGTGVIYTISTGLFRGWRMSLSAALGCTLGIIPHLVACSLSLSAILHMSAMVFQCIKMAGVFYLFYLAWGMWQEQGGLEIGDENDSRHFLSVMAKGVFINILNPKLTIFFLAFLPQFIPENTPSFFVHLLVLSAVFMAMTLLIFIAYGIFAARMSVVITSSPRFLVYSRRAFSMTFVALGLKLASTGD